MKKTILAIFLYLFTYCNSEKSLDVKKIEYLNEDFALNNQFPKEDNLSLEDENKFRQTKNIFEKKFYDALNLYKDKRYTESISKFEETLTLHTSSEVYYQYAKSLKSVGRFKDSIKAFEISEILGFENKKNLYYNLASVHSLNQDLAESVFYLKRSIDNGFKEFHFLEKDDNFQYLKKSKDWILILTNLISNKFLIKNQLLYLKNPNLKLVLKNDSKSIQSNQKEKTTNSELVLFNGIVFYSQRFFDEDGYFFELNKNGTSKIQNNSLIIELNQGKLNTNHPSQEIKLNYSKPEKIELEFKKEINGFVFKNDLEFMQKGFVLNKTECTFIKEINCEDCLNEYVEKGYFCSK